ncbi:amidase domain-containing protein [Lawsonibacter sp. NSJ-51]|uniref:Amidase domain-containing protein n=1 Tax=Lawsonibacter hominis TaxID=2763053 RepID=A0A8J6JD92_9FIRM|nr:amidase domain-containing protein [Lawsonibacter hominis]MBS1384070.1 amidase domain-containing protein [Flavonifractor sp.]
MTRVIPYNRQAAVAYAHKWAYSRNPAFYDYEEIGGDCTNFASQCLYAGTGVMNFTPVFGWYYIDANNKAPAWTGVEYFYRFLTRQEQSPGPFGSSTTLEQMEPGDFVQFRFQKEVFSHTPIIVEIGQPATLENTLVAAHSYDADWRPLSTYFFEEIRFLHVLGAYPPEGAAGPEEGEKSKPPVLPQNQMPPRPPGPS